jgi:hypothetical protein
MNTPPMANDPGIHQQISDLVAEEKRLRDQLQAHEIEPADEQAELRRIEAQLDQCWDLLRQRRARREFGQDPDEAAVRDAGTVENYRG